MKRRKKLYVVSDCRKCPHCVVSRTVGAGCAEDYDCKAVNRLIAGYVEYDREFPKSIPSWCPLEDAPS